METTFLSIRGHSRQNRSCSLQLKGNISLHQIHGCNGRDQEQFLFPEEENIPTLEAREQRTILLLAHVSQHQVS